MRYQRIVLALAVSCWFPLGIAVRTADAARPNVVFFLIDDLGWKDAGFMGSRFYSTPNVDRLAKQGMVFTSAYSNGPNCAPTRACLMSGWYAPRHGIYTVGTSERGRARLRKLIPVKNRTTLPDGVVTLAESLKSAGYVTAHMGKLHLGPDPKSQGFDVNIGGNRTGSPRGGYFSPYRNPQLPNGPKGEYLTDRLTDEALKFLDANRKKPFFLYLAHYAVHTPIQAKADLVRKYQMRLTTKYHNNSKYAAMIDSVDQSVGLVLKKLDDLKLAGNTIVVYTSDNGGYGPVTSQHPLRGSKGMLYEGGIRVPLIVRWPGHTKPGSRSDVPVASIDFYPTLLEAAGVKRGSRLLDGESLVPLLEQKGGLKRKALFWHFPAYLQAYRGMPSPWRTTPAGTVRAGDWKLLEFFEDGRLELYNLKDDIGESKDLAKQRPEKTRELHGLLKAWRKAVSAPVPTEKNPVHGRSS